MKRILAVGFSVCLLCSLWGCAKTDDPYVPTGNGLTVEEDYTAGDQIQSGTDQVLSLTYYPDRSMNPFICTDFTNRTLFSLLYQSLFTVDRGYNIEPLLCKSYRVSQDMKTYTFYLEAARFADGTALTAQDVAASLEAARASTYYKGRFTHISQILANEDGSVTVTTDTAMENLPLLLDIPIIKQSQLEMNAPMGTGPYYLDTTSAPLLRRNTGWWCRAEMAVTAAAITLMPATSIAGIRDSFEFEGLSLVCADPGSDRYADYRCDYELWDCENHIFLYLACNMESEVFSDPTVRSALTFAIDRDTLVNSYYRGFARSASLPASPQSPLYSESLAVRYTYDGGEKFTQAVTDASKYQAEVRLLVNKDDSLRLRIARDIGKMLENCGLKVTMLEQSTATYEKTLKQRGYDLYLGQTKLSPNMDLSAFFATRGAMNAGGLSDVALNTLCTESLANYGNYYTLHKNVMDDGRLCPILFRSYAIYATRGLLTGLTPARDNVFYYTLGKTMEDARLTD